MEKENSNIILTSFPMVKIFPQHRFSSIQEFQLLPQRKLGSGSFGTVFLARHKATSRMYAVKMINLKDLPSETEVKLIEREVRLHGEVDHPHIARLWETLLDGNILYLIMEYAEKGNLFYHQNAKGIFPEPQAFKYFAQALSAILFLHAKNIVHRDIKPENLLLDEYCNIKLCDFGWSAEDKSLKRNTFCGTYEYMAPQMLFEGAYDYRIDIWALGILLYQMLHGRAPFRGKSEEQVMEAMQTGTYQFGEHVSQQVKKLIAGILQFNPEKRLKGEDILNHPWFKNMETYVNNRLILENAASPKEIHEKILKLTSTNTSKQTKADTNLHRKNKSMNNSQLMMSLPQGMTLNQNLKISKPKKHASQQKEFGQTESKQLSSFQINKMLLDCTNKICSDAYPIRPKSKDKSKPAKQGKRNQNIQKNGNNEVSLKKYKFRNSQVQEIQQKCNLPVRFNTQMCQNDNEPPRLKKSTKNKMLTNSKSAVLKPSKNTGKDYLIF